MKSPLLLTVIYLQFLFIRISTTTPSYSMCSLLDSVCLTEKARETLPAFLEAAPNLAKLFIDPVKATVDTFYFDWYNITMEGLKDAVIDNVSVSMHYKILRLEFHTTIVLKQMWDANGLVFSSIPFKGRGGATIVLKNMHVEMLMPFDIIKNEKGQNIMDLKTHYYGFNVDNVHYDMDHLFAEDKEESKLFHEFVNTNWRTTLANYGVYLNGKLTTSIFEAIKTYLHLIPLKDE